ncbi:MAG: hypothetical protein PHC51_02710 [bacterium]|nr:hypothetical protein [bacterium]
MRQHHLHTFVALFLATLCITGVKGCKEDINLDPHNGTSSTTSTTSTTATTTVSTSSISSSIFSTSTIISTTTTTIPVLSANTSTLKSQRQPQNSEKSDNSNTGTLIADDDLDGLSNDDEATAGSLPYNPDSDGDGYSDSFEFTAGSNLLEPSDFPGQPLERIYDQSNVVRGSAEDPDSDGLSNTLEDQLGTDSSSPDTNGDGIIDGFRARMQNFAGYKFE